MKNMNLIAVIGLALLIGACAKPQGNERLQEKAEIEAGGSQNAIDKKAQEMERGLTRQQRFFQNIAGIYEGQFRSESNTLFNVTFVITPTIPLYTGDRIRNVDEITYELTSLAFSIEERMWRKRPDGTDFSAGHNYEKIKPLTDNGLIHVNEDNYPVSFTVSAIGNQADIIKDQSLLNAVRTQVAKDLLDGNTNRNEYLQVEMRSTNLSYMSTFILKKKK